MKYALFLGCTVPTRGLNYELSTRKVCDKLGIELVDIEEFSCCGFPVRSTSNEAGFVMAMRNLALAEKQNLDIITLCSACAETLVEANHLAKNDPEFRNEMNGKLKSLGLKYNGNVEVKHFARMLHQDYGLDKIRAKITTPLDGITVSTHYGCHYLKPSEIYDHYDDPENPHSLDELIEVTGAKAVPYSDWQMCCGGSILGVKEETSLKMAKKKLDSVSSKDTGALVLICPFCSVMYEGNQKKIEREFETEYKLPILYYPMFLGLALGLDPKDDLGFKLSRIKAKNLLARLENR
ncbi:CoB--CoM heterodisulfide reductase subunit B [bacterium]|nr:MAG: CoB--CoM heterodisulfide reductase subunit B [bacterium]